MTNRTLSDHLKDAPSNWGRWGSDDEIGALNFLTSDEVLAGVQAVESGTTFTLGIPIGHPDGDPVSKTGARREAEVFTTMDKGQYEAGKAGRPDYAGLEAVDDIISTFTHGTTHMDALGHPWYDDQLYNGFDAVTTNGGLERCSIEPIAEHGVCGRGVLLDIARHRGVDHLDRGEQITLDELEACAEAQNVDIEKHSILLIRTGWLEVFYEEGPDAFFGDINEDGSGYDEPGITASEEILEWFYEKEIPMLGTDTISNEQYASDVTGSSIPLHGGLIRDQGVVFNEILKLDELASDCSSDGQYEFLFVGAPLKIHQGAGSPVNPIVIK